MSSLRPRRCVMQKTPDGYGFHLHAEKRKSGQFIRLVEPDTPAAEAGLRAGDRLAFVNGENVEGESHQQVVARIRATEPGQHLELIVYDNETAELLEKHGLRCQEEYVTEGIPVPGASSGDSDSERGATRRNSSPVPQENGDTSSERSERLSVSSSTKGDSTGPRPRLCVLKKGDNGYGFNLHSEKSRPGQFIRAVDDDSPAERAGLRPKDKIVQVNGQSVVGMQHSDVVSAIKAGGDETRLLVVDSEADQFFKSCNVLPSEEHLTGLLPEPVPQKTSEDEEPSSVAQAAQSQRSSVSSSSSDSSLRRADSSSTPPEVDRSPESDGLGMGLSLAQARERAHQKRAAKKAPNMAWSKRNELFSNL